MSIGRASDHDCLLVDISIFKRGIVNETDFPCIGNLLLKIYYRDFMFHITETFSYRGFIYDITDQTSVL